MSVPGLQQQDSSQLPARDSRSLEVSPRALPFAAPPASPTATRKRGSFHDLPWFLLALAVLPLHRELYVCLGILGVMGIAFRIRYYPREGLLFVLGCVIGLVFEVGGDAIYKLQYWADGSLFGVPAWLPLFWGLGFVFIRRFGNAVVDR